MINLFLVEQEKFIRDMFEIVLKEKGHQIYTVDSSHDCLYLIRDLSPNVILVDLNTAGEHADSFISELKEADLKAKIIALTSDQSSENHSDTISLFDGEIKKPVSPSDIEQKILSYIGDKSAG